jgi:acetyltransferase-like isoleucine patch superfamily enzyme
MSDDVKNDVIRMMRAIWESDGFELVDSERTRRLREELLKRVLSLVMSDDERARLYGLGEGCRIRENAKIISPEKLVCGEHVWIGEGVTVDASGGLEIGSHTTLGTGCCIWSHTSVLSNLMMDNTPGNNFISRRKTVIGAGSFIGGPSVVYPGVTIGNRCVVMPMSVVTENVPDNTMVGGAPARFIRAIDDAYLAQLAAAQRAGGEGAAS